LGGITKHFRSFAPHKKPMNRAINSLFISSWGSNPGFAAESSYETMFCRAGIELASGDPTRVHFAFASLQRGRPRNLPEGINIFRYDSGCTSPGETKQLLEYVQRRKIEFIQLLDYPVLTKMIADLRKAGARTIISYWGAPISGAQPRWKYLIRRLELSLWRSRRLDGLIFESRAMARLATHERGVPTSLVDIIPLGVDINFFRPRSSEYIYEHLGFPLDRRVIVYAGHVIRRKGIHILVRAAMELLLKRKRKDVAFLLCGNRDGESQEFERMYQGRNLDSLIRFGGYRSDLREIFCSAYCGVIPTVDWESFAATTLEMAACGLPIVASRLHGLVEAISDGTTGILFTPGNATELADVLERLLDEPGRAAELGSNARRRCEGEFTREIQFARYLATLERRLTLS
jgi:glycosyltransferase involved in cell wall biosynthesis